MFRKGRKRREKKKEIVVMFHTMFSMTSLNVVVMLALFTVPVFAVFVKFIQQPDFAKLQIPSRIIISVEDTENTFRCLEMCKNINSANDSGTNNNRACLSVLIRNTKCFLLDTYCSTDAPMPVNETNVPKLLHYRIPTFCEPGWYPGGASCYKLSESKTLDEAKTDCHRQGASIVTIEHGEENAILKQMLTEMNNDTEEFYMGMDDCGHPGHLTYSTHDRLERAHFLDWYADVRGRGQDCCVVMNKNYNYSWSRSPCDEASPTTTRGAICEKKYVGK